MDCAGRAKEVEPGEERANGCWTGTAKGVYVVHRQRKAQHLSE